MSQGVGKIDTSYFKTSGVVFEMGQDILSSDCYYEEHVEFIAC